jgi:hypothetical protein
VAGRYEDDDGGRLTYDLTPSPTLNNVKQNAVTVPSVLVQMTVRFAVRKMVSCQNTCTQPSENSFIIDPFEQCDWAHNECKVMNLIT